MESSIQTLFVEDMLAVQPKPATLTISFEKDSNPTLKSLKTEIQKKTGYYQDWYRLVSKDTCKQIETFDLSRSLTELGLSNQETICVCRRLGKQEFDDFYDALKKKMEEYNTCCICLDRQSTIILFPCFHSQFCSLCATQLKCCPLCRIDIKTKFSH